MKIEAPWLATVLLISHCFLVEGSCSTGSARLAGSRATSQNGTVEICYNNQWGTVCDVGWDARDAGVVCKQLGFNGQSIATFNAFYGIGNGSVLLRGLICTGSETSLLECGRTHSIGSTSCSHSDDAGVMCSMASCAMGSVRLAGTASTTSKGRVEVCYNNSWGTVCDDEWDLLAAAVVCRQLGYTGPSVAYSQAYFGQGTGSIFLGGLDCNGTETSLLECNRNNTIGLTGCSHVQDAGVECSDPCRNGAVRLTGGSTITRGRVEICYNNSWGTVCDDDWDQQDATVVCRQLGYTGTSTAYSGALFGNGTGPIYLSGLSCNGSELNLLECPREFPLGLTQCSHSKDAGVQCTSAAKDKGATKQTAIVTSALIGSILTVLGAFFISLIILYCLIRVRCPSWLESSSVRKPGWGFH